MREKELCFVISFDTTTQALSLEDAAKSEGISGRLIPLPTQISAGCGLAWKMPLQEKESMLHLMTVHKLEYQQCYELMI